MQKVVNNKPFFILAPMDDVTDTVFREVVQANSPADLYFTEFVNVDGLCSSGRPKLLKKLRFSENEGPSTSDRRQAAQAVAPAPFTLVWKLLRSFCSLGGMSARQYGFRWPSPSQYC